MMEQYSFTEFRASFPVCNHAQGFEEKYNHGYLQGVTGDGMPFEAELWSTETEENISIVFPENFDMYDGIDPYEDALVDHKPDEPIPYQRQDELVENSMLTIGMVRRGRINNINVIIAYVDYFEQCGLYEFVTEYRNGCLMQMTDINGNYLLQLNITTWSEDMGELVDTYMDFKPFFDVEEKKAIKGNAKVLKFPGRD